MNKRSLVLPVAIILGFLINRWCGKLSAIVPYLIFTILLMNFSSVRIRQLRLIHMSGLNVWLLLFQILVSIGCYYLITALGGDEIVAEGVLAGVLCPVAAASVVIACMLGANRETITAYTILGNLMVAIVAPIYFSFIGIHQDMPFLESFALILRKIGPVIALPFFVAMFLQFYLPKINEAITWPNVFSFQLNLRKGDEVSKITSSINRYGYFIVSGNTRNDIDNLSDSYNNQTNKLITIV